MNELNLNERINDRLRRIANVLLINASFIDNPGLLNGKMGISIFFYRYGRYLDNKIYTDYAGELIDEIYEEIAINTPLNFASGLTGIGWGIEYLVKNKFVDADTDEALADIDNTVYRNMLNSPLLLESENDLFGYGHYCLSRL
ncbi:MAG TPA: lanthionine synthetase LanC family protein, partial [Bacteroidales bacterium]|nr:lanthionine synthetase LanC family protein [Bacteroidales bacterium]